jgi:hypothetical protein
MVSPFIGQNPEQQRSECRWQGRQGRLWQDQQIDHRTKALLFVSILR